jgi:hypothetical protein
MKYGKLVGTLMAIASIVTAAAGSYSPAVYGLNNNDKDRLAHFVLTGADYPESLADVIGSSSPLVYDDALQDALAMMIENDMVRSFEVLFPRIVYERSFDRGASKSLLLGIALLHHRLDIADMILEQKFVFFSDFADWSKCCLHPSSSNPERLEDLKALISRHPEMAYDLAPSPNRIQAASGASEAIFLIDIAQHCDAERHKLGRQKNTCFNPTDSLYDVVLRSAMTDVDMDQVARHLLELGAAPDTQLAKFFRDVHPGYEQTYQLLLGWSMDDVKVTEEEAENHC